MADKIKMRRGELPDLPTLDDGEIGLAMDVGSLYIGNPDGDGNILVNPVKEHPDGYSLDGYLVPAVDNLHGLGTLSLRWKNITVGPGSVHLRSLAGEIGSTEHNWTISIGDGGNLNISSEGFNSISLIQGGGTAMPDGSAAAPTYSFASDTDTGIYLSGTNELSISTAGTKKVTVDASGNLDVSSGIKVGTTTSTSAGFIRWNGTNFEGRTSSAWIRLDVGGSDKQVQFNDNGNINGDSQLTWNNSTKAFTVGSSAKLLSPGGATNSFKAGASPSINTGATSSIAIGTSSVIGTDASYSIAIGTNLDIPGFTQYVTTMGYNSAVSNTGAHRSIAVGYNTWCGGADSVSIGSGTNITNGSHRSIAIGGSSVTVSAPDCIVMGDGSSVTTSSAYSSVAIGDAAQVSSTYSVAIGPNCRVLTSANAAVTLGYNAYVNQGSTGGVAIGTGSIAGFGSTGAVAVGNSATTGTSSSYAIAIGDTAFVDNSSNSSIALGHGASATNSLAVAVGGFSSVSGSRSIALGYTTSASGTGTICIGQFGVASNSGIGIGQNVNVSHSNSVAIGNGATTTAAAQCMIGSSGTPLNFVVPFGSVGIGTNNPLDSLHVFGGNIRISNSANPGIDFDATAGSDWNIGVFNNNNWRVRNSTLSFNPFVIQPAAAVYSLQIAAAGVGIGTGSPQSVLHVEGDGYFVDKIGIGTVPSHALHIEQANVSSATTLLVDNPDGSIGSAATVTLQTAGSQKGWLGGTQQDGIVLAAAESGIGKIKFWTYDSPDWSERMTISNAGDVGIGQEPIAGSKLSLPQEADDATPTLSFGDGDTGFYETLDDFLRIAIAGTAEWGISNTFGIYGLLSNAPAILNESSSATNPTLCPSAGDLDTGIGRSGTNALSLITGGVEAMRIDSSQNTTVNGIVLLEEQVSPPSSGTSGYGKIFTDASTGNIHEVNENGSERSLVGSTSTSHRHDATSGTSFGFEIYYFPTALGSYETVNSSNMVADTMIMQPFVSGEIVRQIDQIAIYTGSTTAGGLIVVGIYDTISETDIYPNNLVFQSGEFDVSSGTGWKTTSVSQRLEPGKVYWTCWHSNQSIVSCMVPLYYSCQAILGWSGGNANSGFRVNQTYSATLPSSFPGGTSTLIATSYVPTCLFRYAGY